MSHDPKNVDTNGEEFEAVLVVEGLGDVVSGIYYKGLLKFVLWFLFELKATDQVKYQRLKIVFCHMPIPPDGSSLLSKKLENIRNKVTKGLKTDVEKECRSGTVDLRNKSENTVPTDAEVKAETQVPIQQIEAETLFKLEIASTSRQGYFEQRFAYGPRSVTVATLDKKAGESTYATLCPLWVLVSTPDKIHAAQVKYWLSRSDLPIPPVILVEKPLEASLDAVRDMLENPSLAKFGSRQVWSFDHYLGKAPLSIAELERIQFFLGGIGQNSPWLDRFAFFFVEDHTALDAGYLGSAFANVHGPELELNNVSDTLEQQLRQLASRMGPVEIELREKTLEQGMILDGAPHILAILSRFPALRVEGLRVHGTLAGRYKGVDPLCMGLEKGTTINDSISRVSVGLCDLGQHPIYGVMYFAKGVRGTKNLYKLLVPGMTAATKILFKPTNSDRGHAWRTGKAEEIKLLVLVGVNGNIVTLDFKVQAAYRPDLGKKRPECLVEFWKPEGGPGVTSAAGEELIYVEDKLQPPINKCEPPFQQLLKCLVTSSPMELGKAFDIDAPESRKLPPAPLLTLEVGKRLAETILTDMKYRVQGELPAHGLVPPDSLGALRTKMLDLLSGKTALKQFLEPVASLSPYTLEDAIEVLEQAIEANKGTADRKDYGRIPPPLSVPWHGVPASTTRVLELYAALSRALKSFVQAASVAESSLSNVLQSLFSLDRDTAESWASVLEDQTSENSKDFLYHKVVRFLFDNSILPESAKKSFGYNETVTSKDAGKRADDTLLLALFAKLEIRATVDELREIQQEFPQGSAIPGVVASDTLWKFKHDARTHSPLATQGYHGASLWCASTEENKLVVIKKANQGLSRQLANEAMIYARLATAAAVDKLNYPTRFARFVGRAIVGGSEAIVLEWLGDDQGEFPTTLLDWWTKQQQQDAINDNVWQTLGNLVEQVREALLDLSALGIVHRDLAADNVIVVKEKANLRAVVIDFGLATTGTPDQFVDLRPYRFDPVTHNLLMPGYQVGRGPKNSAQGMLCDKLHLAASLLATTEKRNETAVIKIVREKLELGVGRRDDQFEILRIKSRWLEISIDDWL